MKNFLKIVSGFIPLALLSLVFLPNVASAACGTSDLEGIICTVADLLKSIIPIVLSLAVLYFIWGVIRYVIAGGEEAKKNAKDMIIYGIIGLAVITSMWGLVNVITNTFGLTGDVLKAPSLQPLTGASASCDAPSIGSKLQDYFGYITCVINNSVIPLIFTLATLMFLWGTVNFFILNADEEAKRAQGKQFMIWGIIALAVMLSVWGLVGILKDTFGIKGSILPQVTPPQSSNGGGSPIVYTCSANNPEGSCPPGTSCKKSDNSWENVWTCR